MPGAGVTVMKSDLGLVLHGYWRSGTSYRTRIALNLKGLSYDTIAVNLLSGEQRSDEFRETQSAGIGAGSSDAEICLNAKHSDHRMARGNLPRSTIAAKACGRTCDRARYVNDGGLRHPSVEQRSSFETIFPINSVRIAYLRSGWAANWINAGFQPLDKMIAQYGGKFAFGDAPTMADCHLVPQFYSAERFGVDLTAYPHLTAVVERARSISAIAAAAPEWQRDAPNQT